MQSSNVEPRPIEPLNEHSEPGDRRRCRSLTVFISLLVVLLTVMLGTKDALAHAELVRADPAPDSILGAPPQQIDLWFSERVDQGAGSPGLSVLDEDGRNLTITNLHVDPADAKHV